jgi:hypothetical protein
MPDSVAGIPASEARAKFYNMVERHLSREELAPVKEKKARKAKQEPALVVIDDRPVEVERYGDGTRDMRRNNAADAMQWLIGKGHLNSRIEGPRTDKAMEIAWAEGRARINTTTDLAVIFERAELTPLRSPDFEATPGGSFGPRFVSVTKLRCMKIVQDLRRDIPPAAIRTLEAIICRNEFPWHGASKREEQRILQDIRRALDFAAWSLGNGRRGAEITREEMCRRWPESADWFVAKDLAESTLAFKMDRKPN